MKAATHTEVYRPFRGRVAAARWRFVPFMRACIKTATKKKLPLLLLFAPLAIATVIFSFVVYTGLALEAGAPPSALGARGGAAGVLGAAMMAGTAKQLIQAREMIVAFHLGTNVFSLLLMAWFGSGLIADDKRLGAHLLYFARPLTRLDYVLAKFATVAFFGALGAIAPGLVICTVATFASHEWEFLKLESDVIYATIGFGALWTVLVSSIVLCVSSLATRRTFALIGVFAYFMLTAALAGTLAALQRDQDFRALSPFFSCVRLATWMFDLHRSPSHWNLSLAWASVTATIVLAWAITWFRVKRLEVVA